MPHSLVFVRADLKEEYLELQAEVGVRRRNGDFLESLNRHDNGELIEAGPAPCDSDKCLIAGADGVAKPFSEESMFAPIAMELQKLLW